MKTLDDANVVARARRGEEDAYAELLSRYRDRIFTFILRLVGDAHDAEDLAQEAFLKAFRSLDRYDAGRPFISWLFKIAHNTAYDHLRARRVDVSLDDDEGNPREIEDGGPTPEAFASSSLNKDLIEKAFAALPPGYREAILLRHKEELEYAQIAEILGIPEGTVKIRLFRGRDLLKGKLEAFGLGPEK
jgi:RNA polymerase sigma-70 factor (ECF subfamily)